MINLEKKLQEIESSINEDRFRKLQLQQKVEQREQKIHRRYIEKWNSEVLNNKTFINQLNIIQERFSKINPQNNKYSWMFYAADISSRERVKDQVAFYLNYEKVYLQLSLCGTYSRVESYGGEFKIEEIDKAKEDFLDMILEVFKSQNY